MSAWIQQHQVLTYLVLWLLVIVVGLAAFSKCAGSPQWQSQSRELTPDEQAWFDAIERYNASKARRGAA